MRPAFGETLKKLDIINHLRYTNQGRADARFIKVQAGFIPVASTLEVIFKTSNKIDRSQ